MLIGQQQPIDFTSFIYLSVAVEINQLLLLKKKKSTVTTEVGTIVENSLYIVRDTGSTLKEKKM